MTLVDLLAGLPPVGLDGQLDGPGASCGHGRRLDALAGELQVPALATTKRVAARASGAAVVARAPDQQVWPATASEAVFAGISGPQLTTSTSPVLSTCCQRKRRPRRALITDWITTRYINWR